MRSPTKYKFRHYRPNADGVPELIWASDGRKESIHMRKDEQVLKGTELDLEVVQSQLWTPNALADEGEVDILDVYFDAQAVRTSLYFRLFNDTILEADSLADISANEITGTGYTGITVTRGTDWGAPTAGAGTASTTKTFTGGSGGWTAATDLVLATVATGTAGLHIAWAALSATRTLLENDTLDVDMTVSME